MSESHTDTKTPPAPSATGMSDVFDTWNHFDEELYSDITIKFGQCEIKAHKLILCPQSDYFRKLCGPHSKFIEAGKQVVELHDDDEHGVKAMLMWLYNIRYDTAMVEGLEETTFNLAVYTAADKYGFDELRGEVVEYFRQFCRSCTASSLLALVENIYGGEGLSYHDDLTLLVNSAINEQLPELMKKAPFKGILSSNPDLAVNILENRVNGKEPTHLIASKSTTYGCGHHRLSTRDSKTELRCQHQTCFYNAVKSQECWLGAVIEDFVAT